MFYVNVLNYVTRNTHTRIQQIVHTYAVTKVIGYDRESVNISAKTLQGPFQKTCFVKWAPGD